MDGVARTEASHGGHGSPAGRASASASGAGDSAGAGHSSRRDPFHQPRLHVVVSTPEEDADMAHAVFDDQDGAVLSLGAQCLVEVPGIHPSEVSLPLPVPP